MKFEEALGVDVGSEVAGGRGAGRREGTVIVRFVVGEGLGEKTLKAEGAMEKLAVDGAVTASCTPPGTDAANHAVAVTPPSSTAPVLSE